MAGVLFPAIRTTATAVGGALGGPLGAAVGAGVGAVGVEAAAAGETVMRRRSRRRMVRTGQIMAIAASTLGLPVDELADELIRTPEVQALAARLIEAAVEASFNAKLVLLAEQLAFQARPGDAPDPVGIGELALSAVASLERPHVAALAAIAEPAAAGCDLDGHSEEELRAALPAYGAVVESLTTTLQMRGLIRDSSRGLWAGLEGVRQWSITDLGLHVLRSIQAAGDTLARANAVDEADT